MQLPAVCTSLQRDPRNAPTSACPLPMTSFTIAPPCLSQRPCLSAASSSHVSLHSLFFLLSLSLSSAQGQRGVWNGRNTQGILRPVFPSSPEKRHREKADVPKDLAEKRKSQSLSYSQSGCIKSPLCHSGRFAFALQVSCHGILFWCCNPVFTLL